MHIIAALVFGIGTAVAGYVTQHLAVGIFFGVVYVLIAMAMKGKRLITPAFLSGLVIAVVLSPGNYLGGPILSGFVFSVFAMIASVRVSAHS